MYLSQFRNSFIIIFCLCQSAFLTAQSLSISSTGNTGTSGTTWSITGSTLTVTGTANIRASVIVNALANGNLTVVGNTNNFAVTVSEAISSTTAGSSLTIGSMTNTGAITFSADISLAGGIAVMGGYVELNGNITSTATGDMFFQGLGNTSSIYLDTGKTIEKTAGTGLLTLQGNGRINYQTNVGSILASGTARLDVVIINEMDNGTAGLYNVSTGNITTNGGDLWIGAGAKTGIWNGLSVGSTGVPGNTNYNGIDVTGNISTSGGDILLWAFVGSGARGIGYGDITALTSNRNISSGSGDITLMTRYNDFVNGTPDININTSGKLTLAPASGASFDVALAFTGSTTSGTFTGSSGLDGLIIQNFTSLDELVIGTYNGTGLSGDTPYTSANTADITLGAAISIAGPITVYGGDITVSQNLTSTLSGADILLQASGAINLSASKTIQTDGGDVTFVAAAGGIASSASSAIYLYSSSQILTNGGNITLGGGYSGTEGNLYAATNIAGGGYAVRLSSATLTAAGGNIKIYGRNVSSYGDGVYLSAVDISTTGSGTIGIYGDSYGGFNGSTYFGGVTFEIYASTIQTENGNITLKGILTQSQSEQGYGINFYRTTGFSGETRHIQILSQAGAIQITGDRGSSIGRGIGHSSWGNVYFGSPADNSFTASGNVKLTYSSFVNAGYHGFKVKTTGAVTYEPVGSSFISGQTLPANSYGTLAESASSLTIGKAGNTADITITQATSVAGPITIYGGDVNINGSLTSSANGDIFIKGVASTNPSIQLQSGKTITKSGGTGTLTFQGHGRVQNSGTITTSGTGVLNLVLWSDFDNSNNDGGVSHFGTISSNGGHVWMGGSSSNGGSYTWNGLTVGDGPSIGTPGFNNNGLDLFGNITTAGGDFLAWAGNGALAGNVQGIANDGSGDVVNVGTGDIILITDAVSGTSGDAVYFRQNGGSFTLVPNGVDFGATFNWNPTIESVFSGTNNGYNLGTGNFNWLAIENPSTLTSFTIGRYDGMLSGSAPVVMTNSSNLTFSTATTIGGSVMLEGGTITLNANLTTTNNGNISLYSDNPLGLSSARTITAAGTFTYASQGASFLLPVTYPIPNLTLSCTGLTIGKIGNSSAVSIASATTINGPITLHGGVLGLNYALSTSNTSTGDISLNGSSLSGNANLILAAGRTATLNLSSTSNYSGVISGTGSHLIKSGFGDLTLTGANTHTGTTTVSSGMLTLNRTGGSTLPDVANLVVSADINASPGTLNFASDQTINNLSIANNAMCTLNPSKKLTINGVLTNNGTFNINSGSTLVQASSSTLAGSGNYDVQQNITGSGGITPNGRFWYLGSPLSNSSSSALLSYTGDLVWQWNESSFAYAPVTSGQLTQGKSYVLRSGQSTGVIHFLGSGLSNGTVTVANLTRTGTSQQFRGCHLVSNPYPSYLDWDAVTKTNVSTTMYVRTALGTNYNILETYNSFNGQGTSISGPAMTKYIAPMQGFWVKVEADGQTGSLSMDNSMRSHQTSGSGLRSSAIDFPAYLRFNMIDGENKDQVILLMSPDATMTLDPFDSEKMSASGFAQFYTSVNAKKLVINGMKNVKAKTSVPLTLEMPTSKSYTFQAEEFNIEDGLILLEDKQEGVIQDLTINPTYSFFGNAGTNTTRFVVHFQLAGAPVLVDGPMELESLGSDELTTDNIQIVSNNQGTIIVRLDEGFKPEGSIRIFDASGRLVEQSDFNDQETTIQLNEQAGMYFVEVAAGKLMVKKKIVIE